MGLKKSDNLIVSFLFCFLLVFAASGANVIVSEIHYHPLEGDPDVDRNDYEFIEIYNRGSSPICLTGVAFTDGIGGGFQEGDTLHPEEFRVLASDLDLFRERYGFDADGVFERRLSNSGERVTLEDTLRGEELFSVRYRTHHPWPVIADGSGHSLVPVNMYSEEDPDDPLWWRASAEVHGSPGREDPEAMQIDPIYINEVLATTSYPEVDWVEIYNPNEFPVDISYWFITDQKRRPRRYQIPAGTIIEAHGYMIFDEYDFEDGADPFAYSRNGEEPYIFSGNEAGELTGYSHGFEYGPIEEFVTYGRYVTSTGQEHFVPMAEPTPGAPNSAPRSGPLVITELHYQTQAGVRYIEIRNISNEAVRLYNPDSPEDTWRVSGVGSFEFPDMTVASIGQIIYLVDEVVDTTTFRVLYNIPDDAMVFNFEGTLSRNGELIRIRKPIENDDGDVYRQLIDAVDYQTEDPWPVVEDNWSIVRIDPTAYGNDPINWEARPGRGSSASVARRNVFSGASMLGAIRNGTDLRVSFSVKSGEELRFNLYDLRGRLVFSRDKQFFDKGNHVVDMNLDILSSGKHVLEMVNARGKSYEIGVGVVK
ncbi:lamin tail domain-containing protein [Chitinispirillales bacterium ANBcel5]|uniref:lamin tail domain-containing protein n=1 Tax=Cellulosispirillum alkaliphilum TaxID=3039283 RepID=UPI002A55518B|nr:lamin tail domain-containing protein [Chitinispirillales bacterium ANBcel5]